MGIIKEMQGINNKKMNDICLRVKGAKVCSTTDQMKCSDHELSTLLTIESLGSLSTFRMST